MLDVQLDKVKDDGAPQTGYINDNKYSLEIKVPDPNNSELTITKRVHLLVDWEDIENKPEATTGNVEGANLTDSKIIVGAGGSSIKASTASIALTLAPSSNDMVPTAKAVAEYVDTNFKIMITDLRDVT